MKAVVVALLVVTWFGMGIGASVGVRSAISQRCGREASMHEVLIPVLLGPIISLTQWSATVFDPNFFRGCQ
jgi:hypothetical protein